jgi:hypothetical protein
MLASTMQFSTNNPVTPGRHPPHGGPPSREQRRPACAGNQKQHAPQPTGNHRTEAGTPPEPRSGKPPHGHPGNEPTRTRHHDKNEALLSQDPTVCQTLRPRSRPPTRVPRTHRHPLTHQDTITRPCHDPTAPPRTVLTARRPPWPHLFVDIPPMSTHRGTNARAMG